jgi:beta-carotene hydroxylase
VKSKKRYPILPKTFTEPSHIQTLLYALYAFSLLFVPSILICIHYDSLSLIERYLGVASSTLLGGAGFYALASTAHDGFHLSLAKNRTLSRIIGVFCSSAVPGFFGFAAFGLNHWYHHQYTNSNLDPDRQMISKQKSLLSRILLTRLRMNRQYIKTTFRIFFHKDAAKNFVGTPFSPFEIRAYALLNLILQVLWLGLYIFLLTQSPSWFLIIVAYPMVCLMLLASLTAYLDHAGIHSQIVGYSARIYTTPFFTLMQSGNNYHNLHHIYPKIPGWRLPFLFLHIKRNKLDLDYTVNLETNLLGTLSAVKANADVVTILDKGKMSNVF